MTFTYDLSLIEQTDSDGVPTLPAVRTAVRFLVGDTSMVEENQYAQDEEIDFLIRRWFPKEGTAEYVAAVLADTIAARYAPEVSYSADGVSIGLGAVAEQFRALAVQLRVQHKALLAGGAGPDAGGVTPGEGTLPGIRPKDMGTGMHDNIEAGRQSYGDRDVDVYPNQEALDWYGEYDG